LDFSNPVIEKFSPNISFIIVEDDESKTVIYLMKVAENKDIS
jgi:hypothetical protein